MTADTRSSLLPTLRFLEFRDMPGWKPTPLSDVLDYEQPGKYIVEDSNYTDTGIPVLTANKSFVLGHTAETDGIYQNVPVIIFDDFTTDAKYVDFPFKVKSSAIKILTSRGDDELKLVYELMSGIRFDPTQHKRYYISQYQHLEIPLPCRTEQQKIVDCLGSLDDIVASEGRILEVLRQHKQGLMQQLFPQPYQAVPRLRFPKFKDAPEWQTSTIGERCESFSGGTPDTSKKAYYGGTIPFIRSAEIGRDVTEMFLTDEGLANSAAKMVRRGDVLVALYGANSGDTALARIDGAINQAIMCLRSRDSVPFLYHYLTARKSWIIATYLQGGQGNLSGQIVLSVPLSIPHRDEQEKVADCLSALDTRIEQQGRRIVTLRRHRQGLLQQLFPSLEGQ